MIEIPTEHLSLLLPKFIIDDTTDNNSHNYLLQSPSALSSFDQLFTPDAFKSISLAKSPQITPFESRLHTYMFKKQSFATSHSLSLATLFQDLNFEAEVEKAVHKPVLNLSSELGTGFFTEVIKRIVLFKNRSVKLSAQAKSFNPEEFDKENIPLFTKKLT